VGKFKKTMDENEEEYVPSARSRRRDIVPPAHWVMPAAPRRNLVADAVERNTSVPMGAPTTEAAEAPSTVQTRKSDPPIKWESPETKRSMLYAMIEQGPMFFEKDVNDLKAIRDTLEGHGETRLAGASRLGKAVKEITTDCATYNALRKRLEAEEGQTSTEQQPHATTEGKLRIETEIVELLSKYGSFGNQNLFVNLAATVGGQKNAALLKQERKKEAERAKAVSDLKLMRRAAGSTSSMKMSSAALLHHVNEDLEGSVPVPRQIEQENLDGQREKKRARQPQTEMGASLLATLEKVTSAAAARDQAQREQMDALFGKLDAMANSFARVFEGNQRQNQHVGHAHQGLVVAHLPQQNYVPGFPISFPLHRNT
jgi:hypothetical protein